MPMYSFENDLDTFLSLSDFAQSVQVGAVTISAIFDDAHYEINDYGNHSSIERDLINISSNSPLLLCKTSDVSGVVQGTRAIVGGVEYCIMDLQADGTGVSRLILQKV